MTGFSSDVTTPILALGWFAAINALVSALVVAASGLFREELAADAGRARRLLALRLAPAVSSLIVTAVLFLPAHVRLEPDMPDERIGVVPIAFAAAGLALLLASARRCAVIIRTNGKLAAFGRRQRTRRGRDRLVEVPGLSGVTLAGIFRPRILIGSAARQVLTPSELNLAVAHERAHERARDNLARVLIYCAPDFLGWLPQGRRMERLWEAEAEGLADAVAVAGSPLRATRLASALVKVARLASGDRIWAPGWSTFHRAALLEARVRLLVSAPRVTATARSSLRAVAASVLGVVAAAWVAGIPEALHELTEIAVALLP